MEPGDEKGGSYSHKVDSEHSTSSSVAGCIDAGQSPVQDHEGIENVLYPAHAFTSAYRWANVNLENTVGSFHGVSMTFKACKPNFRSRYECN